jgi:hypothetical protein
MWTRYSKRFVAAAVILAPVQVEAESLHASRVRPRFGRDVRKSASA